MKKNTTKKVLSVAMATGLVTPMLMPFNVMAQSPEEVLNNMVSEQTTVEENVETVEETVVENNVAPKEKEEAAKEETTKETVTPVAEENPTVDFRILGITDLHASLMNHDYYTDTPVKDYGLVKAATVLKAAQQEHDPTDASDEIDNMILVDNGDTIQGNPLGDLYARVNPVQPGTPYPVYKALESLGFDATTLGNHEFNYGLPFLNQILNDTNVPAVSANVYNTNGTPMFDQYKIIEETVVDEQGNEHTLKVGITGFVPPQILNWDNSHLNGKVTVKDMVETAKEVVPQMKAAGADIVVALAHTGYGEANAPKNAENQAYELTKVEGIDALIAGHSHDSFPGGGADNLPNVDAVKGTMNGTATVQPLNWGKELGLIDLKLEKTVDGWNVVDSQSKRQSAKDVANDSETEAVIKDSHNKTVEYVNSPVGQTSKPLNSFFSLVGDDASVELVATAQREYVEKKMEEDKDLQAFKGLPILSAAAPFKAGLAKDGINPSDYVDIAAGDLKIKDVSNLYKFPNTVTVVKLTGANVKEWLEMSAGMFNHIDVNKTEEQPLINTNFRSYNFDTIEGVTYKIDVTKPAKYSPKGDIVNADSSRIVDLEFNGQPIDMNQEFLVVTNNYRGGGGGNFPGLSASKVVWGSSDETRQEIANYIQKQGTITPERDTNWTLKSTDADVNVTFLSHAKAQSLLADNEHISFGGAAGTDIAKYNLDLATVEGEDKEEFVNLQLLTINDIHGELYADMKNKRGGVAYLATHLKNREKENPNTMMISAGDAVGGTPPVSALKQDQPILEVMEKIGFDLSTTGNHEYDEGIDELFRLINGGKHEDKNLDWDGTDFPWVTANVVWKDGEKKGEPILDPYRIEEVDGVKVGYIGIVTVDTAKKVVPAGIKDVEFVDETEAIDKYTEELKAQGVKSIVVVSHVPTQTDKETGELMDLAETSDVYDIAQKVNGEVDVIIGADNHQYANSVVKREGKDDIRVVQAYSKGSAFADVDIKIDPATGDVVSTEAEVVNVTHDVEPDAEIAAMVEGYKNDVASELNRKVGFAEDFISRTIGDVDGDGTVDHFNGEAELGRLIAEAQLWAAHQNGVEDAQISMMNIGGVRADLQAGEITYEDIYTIQPFGNDLTYMTLTGAQIQEILEKQSIHDWVVDAQQGKYNRPRMLQIAGMKYTWHAEKNEEGKYVVKVDNMYVIEKDKNGKEKLKAMKATDTFKTVANIFLAQGGDGFDTFTKAEGGYTVFKNDLEAFEDYTKVFSELDNDNDGTKGIGVIDAKVNPNVVNVDSDFNGEIEGDVELDKNDNNGNGGDNNGNGGDNNGNGGDNNGNGGDNNGNGGDNNGNVDGEEDENSPQTGDQGLFGWVAALFAGAAGLFVFNKRKSTEK